MNIFQELKEKKDILTKDGKVDALGPYGRQKLTGQEVAQYFKKNKVKDAKIKKAVEVALDLGGAMSVAQKEIKKFFGNKILNSKEVKHALKYANESFEMNQLVGILHEDINNLTEKSLIPDLQKIVDTKGAAKVGGVMVDMFTASMITQIYDKVNDKNKQKMDKSKIEVLVNLAQKMMQKMEYDPSDIVEGRAMKPKQIARKYKKEIEMLAKKGQSPEMGRHKVYMALYNLAWENGDINTDDPDQTDEVIDEYLDDIMGEFFAHLESVKEGFKSDAQRRAAFASGYKAKGKKDKKEEVLDENEEGLKNKAEKSGMPLGILKQVYNRGLAAYKTGHRPGATAPQWAMARVNSFVTKSKGTWGGADKDLAAKVKGKSESVELQLQDELTETLSQVHNLMEKPYDDKDVKNVEKLEKKLQNMLKEVDKTMRGSGLSAPAFSMVRGGIVKGLESIKKFYKIAKNIPMKEEVNLQEGTWAIPDSYPKLVKLQDILKKKNIAKDAKTVHKFTDMIYDIFGDDSFFDELGSLETISKGGEVDQYDGERHSEDYMKRSADYAKKKGLKAGMDMNELLMRHLTKWTGGDLKFKGNKIVQMPREWYFRDNPEHTPDNSPVKAKLESASPYVSIALDLELLEGRGGFKGFGNLPKGKMKRPRGGSIKAEEKNVMDSYRAMWENAIVEKKEMNPKIIQKIAKLTDRNDHNESLLLLAKELRDKEAIKLLGSIKDMHKVYGHMPQELIQIRNQIFDNLMRQSKNAHSNHDDVYGAL